MFNLLPPEMCRLCFHVHDGILCLADDWAPHPDGGDVLLGLCRCYTNVDAEHESHLVIVQCEQPEHSDMTPHGHTEYRP